MSVKRIHLIFSIECFATITIDLHFLNEFFILYVFNFSRLIHYFTILISFQKGLCSISKSLLSFLWIYTRYLSLTFISNRLSSSFIKKKKRYYSFVETIVSIRANRDEKFIDTPKNRGFVDVLTSVRFDCRLSRQQLDKARSGVPLSSSDIVDFIEIRSQCLNGLT